MAKSVTALKQILKREEATLEKLQATVPLMAHKESKASLKEIVKTKKNDIRTYKAVLKASEKCPAVNKAPAKKTSVPSKSKKKSC